jgi:hypothetical protein
VDYRKLNNIIVKNKFPLPRIDEFLDKIAGPSTSPQLILLQVFIRLG